MVRKRLCLSAVILASMALHGCFFSNAQPVARIAASVVSGVSPLVVMFDGTGSSDPDGSIASYSWSFDDGTSSELTRPTHTFRADTPTTFTVTLIVTDNDGSIASASQTIEVGVADEEDPNAPTARITVGPTAGNAPLRVTASAALSRAAEGTLTLYAWEFGDGASATGETVTYTYEADANTNFVLTLTVTDDHGRSSSSSAVISVYVPETVLDDPPQADMIIDPPVQVFASPTLPNPPSLFNVKFDPAYSMGAAGHQIEFYIWDFGDGSEPVTMTEPDVVEHTYSVVAPSRVVIVTLTVIDDQGLSDTAPGNVTLIN